MSLSGKQQAVALLLVQGQSPEQAAAAVSVSARTVHRWKKDATFVAELKTLRDQLRGDAVDRTIDFLTRMLPAAVAGHCGLLKAENERTRLAAIMGVYEWQARMFEQHDLAAEVAELRRMVEADRKARGHADPRRNGRAYR